MATEIVIVNDSPDIIDVHVQDPGDVVCFDFGTPGFWTQVAAKAGRQNFPAVNDRNYVALIRLNSEPGNSALFVDSLKAGAIVVVSRRPTLGFSVSP